MAEPEKGPPLVFLAQCVTTGALATAAGAVASLLAPDGTVRAVVWAVVAVLVAAGAGLWRGLSAPGGVSGPPGSRGRRSR